MHLLVEQKQTPTFFTATFSADCIPLTSSICEPLLVPSLSLSLSELLRELYSLAVWGERESFLSLAVVGSLSAVVEALLVGISG